MTHIDANIWADIFQRNRMQVATLFHSSPTATRKQLNIFHIKQAEVNGSVFTQRLCNNWLSSCTLNDIYGNVPKANDTTKSTQPFNSIASPIIYKSFVIKMIAKLLLQTSNTWRGKGMARWQKLIYLKWESFHLFNFFLFVRKFRSIFWLRRNPT